MSMYRYCGNCSKDQCDKINEIIKMLAISGLAPESGSICNMIMPSTRSIFNEFKIRQIINDIENKKVEMLFKNILVKAFYRYERNG